MEEKEELEILKNIAKNILKKDFEEKRRKFKEEAMGANMGGIEADKVFCEIFEEATQEYTNMLKRVLSI